MHRAIDFAPKGRLTTQSSTIVYEIEPGGHLGWLGRHRRKLNTSSPAPVNCCSMMAASIPWAGSVFVLPTPLGPDLVNVGTETLWVVTFFAAAMFTHTFYNMMLPPKTHILDTPNRNG